MEQEIDNSAIMLEIKKLQAITAISMKPVLTKEEAEIYTGFTADHLYRQHSQGKLAYIKHGRCVRYLKEDLDKWLMQNRITPQCEIEDRVSRYLLMKARAAKL